MTGKKHSMFLSHVPSPKVAVGPMASLAFAVTTLVPALAFADGISASLDKQVIGVGQTVVLTLRLTSNGREEGQITGRPDFGKFRAMGSSQNTEFRSINGKTELTRSYRLQLKAPEQAGTYRIGSATAKIGVQEFRSRPLTVRVLPLDKLPKAPKTDRVMVRAEVSKQDPYVGEQVRLSYDLYVDTKDAGPFSNTTLTDMKEPPLDGFWIEDLGSRPTALNRTKVVNGKEYSISSLKNLAVFPLNTGTTTLEPLQLEVEMGGGSLFRRRRQSKRKVSAESEPVKLTVRPLPAGAPEGFHASNVGAYTFNVAVDRRHVKVGEPLTVSLKVYGKGMYNRTRLPEVPENPDAYRLLEPVSKKKPVRNKETVAGEHVVEYVLTPKTEGVVTIPKLDFHFFDPAAEVYRTVSSRPIKVAVAGVAAVVAEETEIEEREAADEPEAVKVAKRPLIAPRPIDDEPSKPAQPVTTHFLFLLGLVLPAFAYGGVVLAGQMQKRRAKAAPKKEKAAAVKKAAVSLDGLQGRPDDEVFSGVNQALNALLENKIGRAALGQRESSLKETLLQAGAKASNVDQLLALRRACDAARFGAAELSATEALTQAKSVMGALEAEL